jgi:spermidine/putrescine transport system substrate-binding protein
MTTALARMSIRLLLAVLVAAALGACQKQEAPPPPPAADAAAGKAAPAAAPGGTLNLYNWNDYLDDQTVARFEQQANAKVVQTYYSDNDEMLAKLAAGATGYDVVVPTANAVEVMIRRGDLQPLDRAALTNIGNIRPEFASMPYDPDHKYSVPYAFSVTVIGFNDAALQKAGFATPAGWESIFDPTIACKLKGRITVLDSPDEVFSAAFYDLGIDPNTNSLDDYKKAAELIKKAKACWAAFNSASYSKEMAAGNIWLALGYSNDFWQGNRDATNAKQAFHIVQVIPRQGATLGLDNMVIQKSAANPKLANAFINFMMDGRNSADTSNLTGSGTAYTSALQFIHPEVKSVEAVFPPPEVFKQLHLLRILPAEIRQERSRLWAEIKL